MDKKKETIETFPLNKIKFEFVHLLMFDVHTLTRMLSHSDIIFECHLFATLLYIYMSEILST